MKALPAACLLAWATLAHAQHPEAVAYPTKGQGAEQQTKDQGECRESARSESGYAVIAVPRTTFPAPRGVSPPVIANPNDVTYLRALAACMQGRGYTVR